MVNLTLWVSSTRKESAFKQKTQKPTTLFSAQGNTFQKEVLTFTIKWWLSKSTSTQTQRIAQRKACWVPLLQRLIGRLMFVPGSAAAGSTKSGGMLEQVHSFILEPSKNLNGKKNKPSILALQTKCLKQQLILVQPLITLSLHRLPEMISLIKRAAKIYSLLHMTNIIKLWLQKTIQELNYLSLWPPWRQLQSINAKTN